MEQEYIRNFSIIAHIDHGKSTLADRILEATHTITEREKKDQFLDSMELERERGITIKLQAVRLFHQAEDGQEYMFNLIDTPGHVDFSYEVSRSLAACEGAVLVVDAAQGVEAQTVANVFLALENDLEIIPVINKVDLPGADIIKIKKDLSDFFGFNEEEIIMVSAKEGTGIEDVLEAITRRISPPAGRQDSSLRALIFDSHYDLYRGVVTYVRVMEGSIEKGQEIQMMSSGKQFEVSEVGVFRPALMPEQSLKHGQVGYIIAGIKSVKDSRVGDTITSKVRPASAPLPGYKIARPMVFCGLYPVKNDDYDHLRDALERLQLNDSSLQFEPENSLALGFGFRCGFLGLLHMEIVRERVEREYGLDVIASAPNVVYKVFTKNKEEVNVENPAHMPPGAEIESVAEPFVQGTFMLPQEYIGAVMELCEEKRGEYYKMEYLSSDRVVMEYHLPLSEIIYDFYDNLKSKTRGYASFDYNYFGYKKSNLVKVDIYVNYEPVDALSFISHRDKAYQHGKQVITRLKEVIERQMFDIPLQAVIEKRPAARETVKALRKNVTEKLYGGDVTRKRKLLEKQKAGKKRMKQVGKVIIPQEAFMSVFELKGK